MSEHFLIRGGRQLEGVVPVSGSKNATLPILAASLMVPDPLRLSNVPSLTDIDTQLAILEALGKRILPLGPSLLELADSGDSPVEAPPEWGHRMRAGFCVLGPLLARRGEAVVPLPGGCAIGKRPVDLHLKGLAALGARIEITDRRVIATARRLRGATISLAGPHGSTVTGTANLMMAAVLAQGETILMHAAREPEIVALGKFLRAHGARIQGLGESTLHIRGVRELKAREATDEPVAFPIIGDRIEAGTLLIATMMTGGEVTLEGIEPAMLEPVLTMLRQSGAALHCRKREGNPLPSVMLKRDSKGRLRFPQVVASPWPGFPTDLQAQAMAMLSLGEGGGEVVDRVFPERFAHVEQLNRLGGNILREGNRARVGEIHHFHGGQVSATDLRAGAALILAALTAGGVTVVHRAELIRRGYERLDEKLTALGADITPGTEKKKAG